MQSAGASEDAAARGKSIVFDLQDEPHEPSALEIEREKHRRRFVGLAEQHCACMAHHYGLQLGRWACKPAEHNAVDVPSPQGSQVCRHIRGAGARASRASA
jgi:hypothetical protein